MIGNALSKEVGGEIHAKPFSSCLLGNVQRGNIVLKRMVDSESWAGRQVCLLIDMCTAVGYLVVLVSCLAENSLGIVGAFFFCFAHLLTACSSKKLEKWTFKVVAYEIHNFLNILRLSWLLLTWKFMERSVENVSLENLLFFISSMVGGILVGNGSLLIRCPIKTGHQFTHEKRMLNRHLTMISKYHLHHLIQGFSAAIRLDYRYVQSTPDGFHFSENGWLAFLNQALGQEEIDFFNDVQKVYLALEVKGPENAILNRIFENICQRPEASQLRGGHPFNVVRESKEDRRYQKYLQNLVDKAFRKLMKKSGQEKIRFIDRLPEGMSALRDYEPSSILAVIYALQLIEIENPKVYCPDRFQLSMLQCYNSRKKELMIARKNLQKLSQAEKNTLTSYLILKSDSNENLTKKVRELFKKIGRLAGQVHQGLLPAGQLGTAWGRAAKKYKISQ